MRASKPIPPPPAPPPLPGGHIRAVHLGQPQRSGRDDFSPPVGYLVLDGRVVVEYVPLLPPGDRHGRVTLHVQHSLDRGNARGRGQLGKIGRGGCVEEAPFERFRAPVGGVLLLPRRTQRVPRARAGSRPPPPTPPPSPLNNVVISRRAVIGWLSRCVASPPLISLHRLRPSSPS